MNPEHGVSSRHGEQSLDKKREEIERQWTQLLLDWVKVCGQAHTTLETVDFMEVIKMYRKRWFFKHQRIPEDLDKFLEQKFPKLDIHSTGITETRNLYVVASVVLYHCIANGADNPVKNICFNLSREQRTLVHKFCEQLKDVEVTVSAIDAAIAGAFESNIVMSEQEEESHNTIANHQLVKPETKGETSKSLDTNQIKLTAGGATDAVDTIFFKSLFDVKSSALGYPSRIISPPKQMYDKPLSVKTDSEKTTTVAPRKVLKEKEGISQITPKFSKELDEEPTILEATDSNVISKQACSINKSGEDKEQFIRDPLTNADTKTKTRVTTFSKPNIDTQFLKSSFTVKSSTFGCPGNSRLETKCHTDGTLIPVIASNVHTSEGNEDKIKNDTKNVHEGPETLKKHDSSLVTPVNNDPIQTIDTLYLNSPFNIKSSAFGYASKTETFTKFITFSTKTEKNTAKGLLDVGTSNQCDTKELKKENEDIMPPVSKKKDPRKAVDTLFLKSRFSIRSSAFGYPGKTSSKIKNATKLSMLSTANSPYKRSNELDENIMKICSINDIQKNTVNKSKSPSSLKKDDPELKNPEASNLTATPSKLQSSAENGDKRKRYGFKSNRKSVTLKRLDTKPAKLVNGSPIKKIVIAFGNLSRIRAKPKTVDENTLASINETGNVIKSSLETPKEKEEKCSRKRIDGSEMWDSEYPKHVDTELKKPSSTLVVGVADTSCSKCPFTFKRSEMKQLGKSSWKSNLETTEEYIVIYDKRKRKKENEEPKKLSSVLIQEVAGTNSSKYPFPSKPPAIKQLGKSTRKSSLKTTKVYMPDDERNRKREDGIEIMESEDGISVNKETNKPSSVLVNVADVKSSRTPFILKFKESKSTWKKIVKVRDQNVYVRSKHYLTSVISEVPSLNVFKHREIEKKSKGNLASEIKNTEEPNSKRPKKIIEGFKDKKYSSKMTWLIIISVLTVLTAIVGLSACLLLMKERKTQPNKYSGLTLTTPMTRRHLRALDKEEIKNILINTNMNPGNNWFSWDCKHGLCQKVYQPHLKGTYKSLSRCTLLCSGPQLWPHPIGSKYFGNKIIALDRSNILHIYKFTPSKEVQEHLNKAFNLFQMDLERLELTRSKQKQPLDLELKDLQIEFDVENDPDPSLRLDTEESYLLTIDTTNVIRVKIKSPSFCGVRHGLETLSQLILLDQRTGHLITLMYAYIKDAPSFKYRGLMIDTARNYIPIADLSRTIDAMAMCKLNTFHWRISDAASFPMVIPDYPQLFEYGAYDREMVYTVEDIEFLVERAGFRGIRVLIEVAAPGPVGRAWSWTTDAYSPPIKERSSSVNDILCLRLKMHESVFEVLGAIYSFIIKLTKVHDVFHLSNGLFSFVNCFHLMEDRDLFLDKALNHLRVANDGVLPRLPLIWYNENIMAKTGWKWHNFGIQVHEEELPETVLNKYRLIQSSRWDLSCEIKKHRCTSYTTWQQMYNWRAWRDLDVMTIEGGEAVLWTDLVDKNNLDSHLWPRTAAVAERLWSDTSANQTASTYEYLRMDAHRWRMVIRGVKAQTVWPVWCSFNPGQCFAKIKT